VAIAIPAAVLGLAIGRVASHRRAEVPAAALAAAGLALVVLLALPHPRHVDPIRAELSTRPAGEGRVLVELTVDPAKETRDPDWFEILSWQGGGSIVTPMIEQGEGRFVGASAVPVEATWKSVIRLARHDLVMAVPVYFPADPELGLPEIPVRDRWDTSFLRDTDLLMREAHDGPAWPAAVAYGTMLGIVVVWMAALVAGFAALHRRIPPGGGPLSGRRVVVTGALGGIGAASARALRSEGATVVGIDLRGGPGVIAGDVTDAAAMSRALATAASRMEGIDVLVNNAGIGRSQPADATPDSGTRRVLEVNFLGTWIAAAAAVPHFPEGRGHVVNVASGLAIATVPYSAAYTASKRAVAAYSDVLRLEAGGRITVSTVHPGYIATPIHDHTEMAGISLGDLVWADPVERAAGAVVRACLDRPREVTTGARTRAALWFARHLPAVSDAVVGRRVRRALRGGPGGLPSAAAFPTPAAPAGAGNA
jgi:NAD(P)-dependent dehydrogenase (short-subunit alcohol dehydrogenase family)